MDVFPDFDGVGVLDRDAHVEGVLKRLAIRVLDVHLEHGRRERVDGEVELPEAVRGDREHLA